MNKTEIKSEFQFICKDYDLWFIFQTINGKPHVVRERESINPATLASEHDVLDVPTTREIGNRFYKILKQDLNIFGDRAEGLRMAEAHFFNFHVESTGCFPRDYLN